MRAYRTWLAVAALLLASAALLPVRATTRAAPTPVDASAAGRVFYVSPSGSDGNPGTASRPWKTIGKATRTLQPGDLVYILKGTYREWVELNEKANSGTAAQPIAYRAYPGHRPVLDGSTVGHAYRGLFEIVRTDHIEISGLVIRNSPVAGIHVRGSQGIKIVNNWIERSASSGIGAWRSTDIVAEGNVLADCRIGPNSGEEMLTMGSVTRFSVRYNEIYWTNPDCCKPTSGISVKEASSEGWVTHNRLYDLPSTGIYVDGWDGSNRNHHIASNSIYNASTGISLGSERGGPLRNVYIYNNVIHHLRFAGIRFQDVGEDGLRENIHIYHNTVVGSYGHGGAGILIATYNVRNVVLTNNLINFGPDTTVGQIKAYNPSAVTSTSNLVYGPKRDTSDPDLVEVTEGTITADPRFLDGAHQNYHLRSDSPARDSGATIDLDRDHEGVPRPHGAGYDIGAYEYRVVGPMDDKAYLALIVR
jgi:hypothetical protein